MKRFKWSSILSFPAFVAIYPAASALPGIGFAVLILLHEMGHFVDIKRRGLPADMPVFLPGLGAYVRWQAMGVPLETRAATSFAGPLAGFFASVACAIIWWQTGDPFWADASAGGRGAECAEPDSCLGSGWGTGSPGFEQNGTDSSGCGFVSLWAGAGAKTFFSWWQWARDIGRSLPAISRPTPAAPRPCICRGPDRAGCNHPAYAGTGIAFSIALT